jgi:hypothetical protein
MGNDENRAVSAMASVAQVVGWRSERVDERKKGRIGRVRRGDVDYKFKKRNRRVRGCRGWTGVKRGCQFARYEAKPKGAGYTPRLRLLVWKVGTICCRNMLLK